MVTPRRYAEAVVPQGTTTICWDPHELANVMGLAGVRWAVAASRALPLRVLVLAPSCVPSAPGLERAGASFGADEMRTMLAWPEVIGVAEVMDMRGVLARDGRMRAVVGEGLAAGKLVTGHARGLAGADLQAFAAAGIGSDHEVTSGEDLLAGCAPASPWNCAARTTTCCPARSPRCARCRVCRPTLTLCTDDVFPDDLVARRRHDRRDSPPGALRPARDATRCGRRRCTRRCGWGGAISAWWRRGGAPTSWCWPIWPRSTWRMCSPRAAWLPATARCWSRAARPGGVAAGQRARGAALARRISVCMRRAERPPVRLRTVDRPRFTAWGEIEAAVADGAVVLPEDAHADGGDPSPRRCPPRPVLGVLRAMGRVARRAGHHGRARLPQPRGAGPRPGRHGGGGQRAHRLPGRGGGRRRGQLRALLELPVCGLLSDSPAAEVGAAFARGESGGGGDRRLAAGRCRW